MEQTETVDFETKRSQVFDAIAAEDYETLGDIVSNLVPHDLGALLESLPPNERSVAWENVSSERDGDVLSNVHDEVRATLIREMDEEELISAAATMDIEDLAEVITTLPDPIRTTVEESLSSDIREKLETSLSFEEDTAGRLMSLDVVTIRGDIRLGGVVRYLKRRGQLPENTDGLFVIDKDGSYLGKLPINALVTNDEETLVKDVMQPDNHSIDANMDTDEVAASFERYALISAAVLQDGKLLGRITIDDVIDIIREQADHAILSGAGLNEEDDLFAPPLTSVKRRAVWLGINLATAFLAAWVIGFYQGALDKIVALAVLMPVVASMGGIAGSQTLTVTIRGLSLKQISPGNVFWLARKELFMGVINGIIWAIVVGAVSGLWFDSFGISAVIAAAIIINLVCAALSGIMIPLILTRLKIDPALSGAVILTTVTDVVGFMSFLGLATAFLLH